jgi:DNA-binding Lrp family transcriptional regulator
MNDLDASIIALLKRNARMSVTQMSHELGVSRVTIDAHIKKMDHDHSRREQGRSRNREADQHA